MNAYYQNPKITRATDIRPYPSVTVGDKLISCICMIVAALTCSVAIKVEKAVLCTVSFVGFFGVIGSMESGALGMLAGLFLCAIIGGIELLVFKSLFGKKTHK